MLCCGTESEVAPAADLKFSLSCFCKEIIVSWEESLRMPSILASDKTDSEDVASKNGTLDASGVSLSAICLIFFSICSNSLDVEQFWLHDFITRGRDESAE